MEGLLINPLGATHKFNINFHELSFAHQYVAMLSLESYLRKDFVVIFISASQ